MSAVKKLTDCETQLRNMVDSIASQINGDKPIDPESCERYHDLSDEEKAKNIVWPIKPGE